MCVLCVIAVPLVWTKGLRWNLQYQACAPFPVEFYA